VQDGLNHVRPGGCAAVIDALVGQEKLEQSELNDDDME